MAIKRKIFQFDEQYNPNSDLGFGGQNDIVDDVLSDNLVAFWVFIGGSYLHTELLAVVARGL